MLAALNLGAVMLGVASGGLAAAFVALLLSGALALLGWADGPDIGLISGIGVGLAVGGWIAGKRARHSERFHGAITGMALAFLIVIVARLGGSPAPTGTVIWLAALSIFVAGFTGWLAGVRKRANP